MAALSAAEPAEPVVPGALRPGRPAAAQGRDRGAGAKAPDRAVEVPPERDAAGWGGAEGGRVAGGLGTQRARRSQSGRAGREQKSSKTGQDRASTLSRGREGPR